jgi:hypothetical protein
MPQQQMPMHQMQMPQQMPMHQMQMPQQMQQEQQGAGPIMMIDNRDIADDLESQSSESSIESIALSDSISCSSEEY